MITDWDVYESYVENNPYKCREVGCGIDVPAPTCKENGGFCNSHRMNFSMRGLGYRSATPFSQGNQSSTDVAF